MTLPNPTAAQLFERAFWTLVFAFLGVYGAADALGTDAAGAGVIAGIGALLTLAAAVLTDWIFPDNLSPLVDSLARIVRTYVVTVLSVMAGGAVLDLSYAHWKATAIAALPALFTAVKALVASRIGNTGTAALLPRSLDVEMIPAPLAR